MERSPKHTLLATFLIEEKRKGVASFWFPYIETLPKSKDQIPYLFEQAEFDELQGSSFLHKLKKRINELRIDYDMLHDQVEGFEDITFTEYTYFRFIVCSRVFGFKVNGEKTGGLVPFIGSVIDKL